MENKKLREGLYFTLLFCISIFFVFCIGVRQANAANASLYLSPSSATYNKGNTFSVSIKVNSGGEPINASEGILVFEPEKLEIINISKSNSIFELWPTEPSFSNPLGNIVFGGGTSNSYSGIAGTIVTITFKAKEVGLTEVSFSSGSVLAADGLGTNILASMNRGFYVLELENRSLIKEPEIPVVTEPLAEAEPLGDEYVSPQGSSLVSAAPIVFSSTHPEPKKWYSNNNLKLFWDLPTDVTALKLLMDNKIRTFPTILHEPPISSKELENIEDGAWYFHIRFRNEHGWGDILHRKVLIDTEVPEFFEMEVNNLDDLTNPNPILTLQARDSLSGIQHYEIKIGSWGRMLEESIFFEDNIFHIPARAPGKYIILGKAVDAAGNFRLTTTEFAVEALKLPVITDCPQTLLTKNTLVVKGTSLYPDSTITVFVQRDEDEIRAGDVRTDSNGNWSFVYDKSLKRGPYQVWAQLTDSRGAKSDLTDKFILAVAWPPLLELGEIAINYLAVIVVLIALIFSLISALIYGWHWIDIRQRRLKKEAVEARKGARQAFEHFKKELRNEIALFDKKPGLTQKERQIYNKLKRALDICEEVIAKEIRDIAKEVRSIGKGIKEKEIREIGKKIRGIEKNIRQSWKERK